MNEKVLLCFWLPQQLSFSQAGLDASFQTPVQCRRSRWANSAPAESGIVFLLRFRINLHFWRRGPDSAEAPVPPWKRAHGGVERSPRSELASTCKHRWMSSVVHSVCVCGGGIDWWVGKIQVYFIESLCENSESRSQRGKIKMYAASRCLSIQKVKWISLPVYFTRKIKCS